MKLIVGLGNPGLEYENTRHNIGFAFLDFLSNKKNLDFSKEQFNAKYAVTRIDGERVLLIKPLSFMNLSGIVVKKYVDYFRIAPSDILIIQDDLDMNLGRIKFVQNSSSGGHNGIKDIQSKLKTKDILRLKIGISNNKSIDTKNYVLGKFSLEEQNELNKTYETLIDILEDFCFISPARIMNKYNSKKK